MTTRGLRRVIAASAILAAVGFHVPFTILTMTFEYPDILREPPSVVLAKFLEGGTPLLVTWYAYALVPLLLLPLIFGVHERVRNRHDLAVATTIVGVAAVLLQTIGLLRWTFVVPALASMHADPSASEAVRAGAEAAFVALHQFVGVALGEHLGQLLTAVWLTMTGVVLGATGEVPRWMGRAAYIPAALIAVGTVEHLGTVFPLQSAALSTATVIGFVLFTVWLVAFGVHEVRADGPAATPVEQVDGLDASSGAQGLTQAFRAHPRGDVAVPLVPADQLGIRPVAAIERSGPHLET